MTDLAGGVFIGLLVVAGGFVLIISISAIIRFGLRYFNSSFVEWYMPLALFSGGLGMLMIERTFSSLDGDLAPAFANPAAALTTRLTTIVALWAAVDHWIRADKVCLLVNPDRRWLLATFFMYWISNILSPSLFGYVGSFQHSWGYSLVLGASFIMADSNTAARCLDWFKNGVVVYCFASLVASVVAPERVADLSYEQGVLPGLPRLAGLSPHAVEMANTSLLGLILIIAFPFRRAVSNVVYLLICFTCLVLAQSKAVWLCALVAVPVVANYRLVQCKYAKSVIPILVFELLFILTAFSFVALVVLFFTSPESLIESFLNSEKGSSIVSLTGRDVIWDVAVDSWLSNPLFGYGMPLFSMSFRESVEMGFATHAHNQFLDALARSGLVGFFGLLAYVFCLGRLAFRYSSASMGVTAAVFIVIFFRSFSEIPLMLTSIGTETLPQFVMLLAVSGGMYGQPESNNHGVHRC